MNDRPVLYDLFCGAGGAAVGYHRGGFEVIGVDNKPQKNYPFEFVQMDALEFLQEIIDGGRPVPDAIHASPPCQAWSNLNKGTNGNADTKPDLLHPVRLLLEELGVPFVIENVPGAPLNSPLLLCGSMFDSFLQVRRHRLFESSTPLTDPDWPCRHSLYGPRFPVRQHGKLHYTSVVWNYGHPHRKGEGELRTAAMGIDWMTTQELTQAIPPAYTEFIGEQLINRL